MYRKHGNDKKKNKTETHSHEPNPRLRNKANHANPYVGHDLPQPQASVIKGLRPG